MRRAAKRDANEPAIIEVLRAAGYVVEQISGAGLPDLLVSKGGGVDVLEVKQEDVSGMTLAQVRVHERWERSGCRIPVVTDGQEAVEVLAGSRKARTYRDFPWDFCTKEERAKRLQVKP
jgi:hypothetical protein